MDYSIGMRQESCDLSAKKCETTSFGKTLEENSNGLKLRVWSRQHYETILKRRKGSSSTQLRIMSL